ncbi:hypothetical protein CERSUDRAFT_91962 [Gelatoporia subvermispora B]|uniref:Uncharacterized protein n=1 Tax=Ceriporiopsis subvermispora (strain B) TaxID=914234 RepID=M2RKY4_CERS8|nr:hypothetical protein CERSUDRAFT_91962 [Gelatoporia subvermispora B]
MAQRRGWFCTFCALLPLGETTSVFLSSPFFFVILLNFAVAMLFTRAVMLFAIAASSLLDGANAEKHAGVLSIPSGSRRVGEAKAKAEENASMGYTRAAREVYDPRITSPTTHTVWAVGNTVEVTWDTTGLPGGGQAGTGKVVLGHVSGNDANEHLDLEHPLATNVDLSRGHVPVQVPNVPPGNNYIVADASRNSNAASACALVSKVFGDSGNRSPTFSIAG